MEIIHKMMLAVGLVFYQIFNSHFSFRRKGEELKQKMARMKPIIVPSASRIEINSPTQEKKDVSKEDVDTLDDLSKRLAVLRARINKAMTSKNIVNLLQPIVKESTEIPAYVPTTKVSTKVVHIYVRTFKFI